MAGFAKELITLLVALTVFLLPGSAILALSGDRRWTGLQQVFVAAGLGLAFYPILFYMTRALLPRVGLGRWPLVGLLLLALLITLWGVWRRGLFRFRPERLEWAALAVLGLTLASRFWFAHDYPFPAWSDSLHHVLLTDLTAAAGRLPETLEPYFPNVLGPLFLIGAGPAAERRPGPHRSAVDGPGAERSVRHRHLPGAGSPCRAGRRAAGAGSGRTIQRSPGPVG
jgi:hypothetical protein